MKPLRHRIVTCRPQDVRVYVPFRIPCLPVALLVCVRLCSAVSAVAAPDGRADAGPASFAHDGAAPALRLRGFFGRGAEVRVSLNSEATGRSAWVAAGEVFEGWSVESINPVRSEVSVRAGAAVAVIAMAGESASSRGATPRWRGSRESASLAFASRGNAAGFTSGTAAPAEGGGSDSVTDLPEGSTYRRGDGVVGAHGSRSRGAPGAGSAVAAIPGAALTMVGLDSDEVASASPGEASESTQPESEAPVAENAADGDGDTGSFPLLSRAHLSTEENLALAARDARRRYMARHRG